MLTEIEELLARAWSDLDMAPAGGMEGSKILRRTEGLVWEPPCLSFRIERHGGRAMGSSRAELQEWSVNVEKGSAVFGEGGYRQLDPPSKGLDVRPLAEKIVRIVERGKDHAWVSFVNPNRFYIRVGEFIPDDGPKQTVEGRRRRFRQEVRARLEPLGWRVVPRTRPNTFERQPPPGPQALGEQAPPGKPRTGVRGKET